jgi:hypothetical protein
MKHLVLLAILLACTPISVAAEIGIYQHGTIVRMRMGDCLTPHGFMATISGSPKQQSDDACPEYTLVTDRVVYVIVGKSSNQLLPLAETTDFRFQKNELAVRVDDAKHETRFLIREMALRAEWERNQKAQEETTALVRHYVGAAISANGRN